MLRRRESARQPGLFVKPMPTVGTRVIAHYGREQFPGVIVERGGGPANHLPVLVDGWEIPVWFSITALEITPNQQPS